MDSDEDENNAFVIDSGSHTIKAGLSAQDHPKVVFPSVVGRPPYVDVLEEMGLKGQENRYVVERIISKWTGRRGLITPMTDLIQQFVELKHRYVGDEAMKMSELLSMESPIKNGVTDNWDDMETIWRYTFAKLDSQYGHLPNVEGKSVLLAEPPLLKKERREKRIQIMFETFQIKKYYTTIDAVLSLYASGRTTGMVISCGYGLSHIVPVSEGYCLPHAILTLDLAGEDITDFMRKMLREKGYSQINREIARDIKEKLCYVASDYKAELETSKSSNDLVKNYELPDGQVITVGAERFRAPEVLFQPELIGLERDGIHKLASSSLRMLDVNVRRDLYSNVVMDGGSTLVEGMDVRLLPELTNLVPKGAKVKTIVPPERKISSWIGGSILTSLSTFREMWVNKAEYEESGPSIVHRKCF